MFHCMIMNLKISMRWMILEKHKWPNFTQEVEILSMSITEEEAEKCIKELFLRLSPKSDDLSGSSSKGRDNCNVILFQFFKSYYWN